MSVRVARKALNEPRQIVLSVEYGFSQESGTVYDRVRAIKDHAAESLSLGGHAEIRDKIWETYIRCAKPGWGDEDSEPVSVDACNAAVRFVELLPDGLMQPEVVPENDGELALEWQIGRDRIFSVGFDGEGINYAGYFGGKRRFRGQEPLRNELPEEIGTVLLRHFSQA